MDAPHSGRKHGRSRFRSWLSAGKRRAEGAGRPLEELEETAGCGNQDQAPLHSDYLRGESTKCSDHTNNRDHGPDEVSDREVLVGSTQRYRGHGYRFITASEHARMQLGDTYVQQQNVYPNLPPPIHSSKDSKQEGQERAELLGLAFENMHSVAATIASSFRSHDVETCDWLFATKQYQRWRDPQCRSSHHGFLWIKGKPGAGKSVMMKHALENLKFGCEGDSIIIHHFFNARGHELEKSTEGMYRSLLNQLYLELPSCVPEPVPHPWSFAQRHGWTLPVLHDMFRTAITAFGRERGRKLICLVDALDEGEQEAVREAVYHFEDLGELAISQSIDFLVCFASRHYPRITMRHHETINLDIEAEHDKDIEAYVKAQLRGEQKLTEELSREISRRCSGVFLWAALVVRVVNKKMDAGATRSQLLAELNAVPGKIEELLSGILLTHDAFLLPTLQWILFSRHPLTIPQLYTGIMISVDKPDAASWDPDEITEEQMKLFILNTSKGLVDVTRGETVVAQFIHESVREYLLGGGLVSLDQALQDNLEAKSHARLGMWCQAYLRLDFGTYLVPDKFGFFTALPERFPLLEYAIYNIFHHLEAAHVGQLGHEFAAECLDLTPWSAWITLKKELSHLDFRDASVLQILLHHNCERLSETLLQHQCTRYLPSNSGQVDDAALTYVAGAGCMVGNVNAFIHDHHRSTALISAINKGYTVVVRLLLRCGADPAIKRPDEASPLLQALSSQEPNIAVLLLLHGADPNCEDPAGGTPLGKALWHGFTDVVKALLEAGADTICFDSYAIAPPYKWAPPDDETTIDLLSAHATKLKLTSLRTLTSLFSMNDTASLIRLMLASGLHVADWDDSLCAGLYHVLSSLSSENHGRGKGYALNSEVSKSLLDVGAKINLPNSSDNAPSVAADHHRMIEFSRFYSKAAEDSWREICMRQPLHDPEPDYDCGGSMSVQYDIDSDWDPLSPEGDD